VMRGGSTALKPLQPMPSAGGHEVDAEGITRNSCALGMRSPAWPRKRPTEGERGTGCRRDYPHENAARVAARTERHKPGADERQATRRVTVIAWCLGTCDPG
jgi:hypothetical protein